MNWLLSCPALPPRGIFSLAYSTTSLLNCSAVIAKVCSADFSAMTAGFAARGGAANAISVPLRVNPSSRSMNFAKRFDPNRE